MPSSAAFISIWPSLLGLILSLAALAGLSRLLSRYLQYTIFYLTRSQDMSMVIYFLIFMPGVFVHESAHWLMARLLGLKTGKFRVWPQRQGKYIGMGSVQVSSGGVIIDNLVGMAPLIAGTLLITLIGVGVFETDSLASAWQQGRIGAMIQTTWQTLGRADGGLWAYLIFVVGNVMMPSASDRHQLTPLLLYLLLAGILYVLLDLPRQWLTTGLANLTAPMDVLTSAIFFVIVLDVVAVGIFFVLTWLLGSLMGSRITGR